jgi:hypothetical protein
MKKYFNIAALALVAVSTLLMSSCKNEVDEIFDEDAVARLAKAQAQYIDILTSNGGKWQLEYYANDEEPGYVYLMTFSTDGSVVISGMNKWISYVKGGSSSIGSQPVYGSATSLWDVITDNGPVLSFNSYNPYFHLFADPYDIPDATGGGGMQEDSNDESGYGHEGDYEFNIMKFSGDTLYLSGKKYGIDMIMTRVASTIDDQVYMNEVTAQADSFFHVKIPQVYINLPNGVRWIVKDGATSILKIFREGADEISTAETHNVIITHDGLSFMTPITLDGYVIQNFVRQADGSLLCRDDQQTTITADELSAIVSNSRFTWKMAQSGTGGVFAQLIQQVADEAKNFNTSTLQEVQIAYLTAQNSFSITFVLRRRNVNYKPTYYFTTDVLGDEQVKFNVDLNGDTWAQTFSEGCPSIKAFAQALASMTFNLSANSLLAPVNMTLTDAGNSANYMVWNLNELK